MTNHRAEMAEAMYIGAVGGAARNYAEYDAEIEKLKNLVFDTDADKINLIARSRAYKRLSDEIMKELENPEKPRRFSDPKNGSMRQQLLEITHEHELKDVLKNNPNLAEMTLSLIEKRKKLHFETYKKAQLKPRP